jgi:hypothetical protein
MTMTMAQFALFQQIGLWFFSGLGMFVLASMVQRHRRWLHGSGALMVGMTVFLLYAYVCDGAAWWFMPCWW